MMKHKQKGGRQNPREQSKNQEKNVKKNFEVPFFWPATAGRRQTLTSVSLSTHTLITASLYHSQPNNHIILTSTEPSHSASLSTLSPQPNPPHTNQTSHHRKPLNPSTTKQLTHNSQNLPQPSLNTPTTTSLTSHHSHQPPLTSLGLHLSHPRTLCHSLSLTSAQAQLHHQPNSRHPQPHSPQPSQPPIIHRNPHQQLRTPNPTETHLSPRHTSASPPLNRPTAISLPINTSHNHHISLPHRRHSSSTPSPSLNRKPETHLPPITTSAP